MTDNSARRLVASASAGLLIMACLAGCGTKSGGRSAPGPDAGGDPIRVGVTPNTPPIIFEDRRGITGLEADLAMELGKALNRPVKFVELKWEEQIPALLEKKTDIIMSGMSITQMRQVRISFTEPYMRVGQIALAPRDELRRYISRGSIILSKGKIGVEKGTTGEYFVQRECLDATIISYSSATEAAKALIRGKLDLVIHDAPVIWWLAAQHEADGIGVLDIVLTDEYFAWGIRSDDRRFLASVNRALDSWNKDGRLHRIIKRWLPYAK